PMQRRMNLGDLVGMRRAWSEPPSWTAIFVKAFAIVAARRPEFRRGFFPGPRGHLYQHPAHLARGGVEPGYQGGPGGVLGQMPQPERMSLREIEARIRYFKITPVESIVEFARAMRLSRLPFPLRRLIWWTGLNVSGLYRAWYFGTYGVSVTANLGAASLH